MIKKLALFVMISGVVVLVSCKKTNETSARLTPEKVEKLVEEAYFHCFPIVENYKAMYAYSILKSSPMYLPMNTVKNNTHLFSPSDKIVVSPNNDTYYTTASLDLRAEPIIIKVPEIKDRYYSFQLTSLVTDNFGYIGTNTTGTGAGIYAITSPNFSGSLPEGVKEIKSPSEIVGLFGRTEVNADDPIDVESAQAVQRQYQIDLMHKFYPEFQPKEVPPIDFPTYSDEDMEQPKFFALLNFLIQYTKLSADEQEIINSYKTIGIEAGQPYSFYDSHPEFQSSIKNGIAKGIVKIDSSSRHLGRVVNGWTMFPLGEYFGSNYIDRTNIAKMGIYANSPFEAYYPLAFVDSNNETLNGQNNYTIHFPADSLPPAKFFWSLTMYENKTQLLVENEIKRYSIGDRTKSLKYNKDGSLTLYIGNSRPPSGIGNWLPAPEGDFNVMMRLYGPQEIVLNGTWTPPPIKRIKK